MGGHPSLWTQFPLQLKAFTPHCRRLKKFVEIRRLGWVKSVTVTLDMTPNHVCEEVLKHLTRTEELFFIFRQHVNFVYYTQVHDGFKQMWATRNDRLVRIGAICPRLNLGSKSLYLVTNCDASTNAFIKRTLAYGGPNHESITISGPPGVQLSNEVAETICTNSKKPIFIVDTYLMIGQDMDLEKLMQVLKRVTSLGLNVKDCDNQALAPINTILDLLAGKDHGKLDYVFLPKKLLLKSQCLERLGGREKVEAFITDAPHFQIKHTQNGLKIVDPYNLDEGSEDEESEDEESDDEGSEDDEGNSDEDEDDDVPWEPTFCGW